jgi:hypothetical protein
MMCKGLILKKKKTKVHIHKQHVTPLSLVEFDCCLEFIFYRNLMQTYLKKMLECLYPKLHVCVH